MYGNEIAGRRESRAGEGSRLTVPATDSSPSWSSVRPVIATASAPARDLAGERFAIVLTTAHGPDPGKPRP